MNVRLATDEDSIALAQLYAAFFEEDSISFDTDKISKNLDTMLGDPRAIIVVAEVEGQIIGMSSGSLTYGVEFGCAAELEDLYVLPRFRGAGWGNRLAAFVLAWAKEQGATEVILVITPEAERDQSLTSFYEQLGFKNSARITMYRSL